VRFLRFGFGVLRGKGFKFENIDIMGGAYRGEEHQAYGTLALSLKGPYLPPGGAVFF
jgi:hypothetical protein